MGSFSPSFLRKQESRGPSHYSSPGRSRKKLDSRFAGMTESGQPTQDPEDPTFNVGDFYRIHKEYLAGGKSHAGIILARQQRYSVGEQTRRLLKLIATRSAEEMKNQVEFLNVWD